MNKIESGEKLDSQAKELLHLNQNLHFLNLSSERKIYAMNSQKSQN